MKLKFKHQKFQEDAAKAVCDVFAGQPYKMLDYQVETRKKDGQTSYERFTGFRNHPVVPQLTDEIVLKHIQDIQRAQQIKPSEALEGNTISPSRWRQELAKHIPTSKPSSN